MKKYAIVLLVIALALCGCGSRRPATAYGGDDRLEARTEQEGPEDYEDYAETGEPENDDGHTGPFAESKDYTDEELKEIEDLFDAADKWQKKYAKTFTSDYYEGYTAEADGESYIDLTKALHDIEIDVRFHRDSNIIELAPDHDVGPIAFDITVACQDTNKGNYCEGYVCFFFNDQLMTDMDGVLPQTGKDVCVPTVNVLVDDVPYMFNTMSFNEISNFIRWELNRPLNNLKDMVGVGKDNIT
ncbi:MAG: hypothetical protein K5837_01610 [Candidatus Saccharibacteria bacterium]|nr:hypothetical protein [Candidatus Saccharibacteria bacterium]